MSQGRVRRLPAPAVDNPFEFQPKWTWQLTMEVAFGAIFLLPIRLVIFALSLFSLWLGSLVATWDVRPRGSRPMRPVQRFLVDRVLWLAARSVMFGMGYNWIHIRGRRASPDQAPIAVVAPHTSYVDSILVGTKVYSSSVAKQDALTIPLFGTVLSLTEPLVVKRGDKKDGRRVIDEVKKRLSEPDAWTQLLFFPEGTCTNGRALICFKAGPFHPGLPVQPVVFQYGHSRETWTWISPSGILSFTLLLCYLHNPCTVNFLPVYYPSDEEKKNPFLYATNVRAVIAKFTELPCTDHTYEDSWLLDKALGLGLPAATGLVEYNVIHRLTNLNFDTLQEQLVRFAAADRDKDGRLKLEDFLAFFPWPDEGDVATMFSEYDTSASGTVTYRDFLLGYSDLSLPAASHELTREAFFFLSQSGSCISLQTVQHAFSEKGFESTSSTAFFGRLSLGFHEVEEVGFSDFLATNPEYYVLLNWSLSENKHA